MEISEYKIIFENEGSHFFYVGNHALILGLVAKFLPNRRGKLAILDAGCGTGLLGKKLERFGKVLGIDISPHALALAKKRGLAVRKASITDLPFQDNTFDLVLGIDVIYHTGVLSDVKAVGELARVLKPGGILILRAAAYNWLRRSCDLQVHTRQRYTKKKLEKLVSNGGLILHKVSYINMILLPAAIVSFVLEKIFRNTYASTPLVKLHPVLNNMLIRLLVLEAILLTWVDLPFGLGVLAVGRKPTA